MKLNEKIVFYDGDCGLCNRSVAFVLKHEKHNEIHFASIQSIYTTRFFEEKGWDAPDLSTFYFYKNGKLLQKSTAALELSREFKFPKNCMYSFIVVPRFIRDSVYNFIAKRRRQIAKGFCVIPTSKDKERFLS